MILFTPEDLRSCGLSREGDKGWEPASRIFRVMAMTGLALVTGGPLSAIKKAWQEVEVVDAGKSDYKRSDFHSDSCVSSFCRGCR